MARRVFFSFHFRQDVTRAGVVRNSWVTQERQAAGFFDSAAWEQVKKKDNASIERWIDGQLNGTSVTAVLIGENTFGRQWINYEITSSWGKENGLLGIRVHNIKDLNREVTNRGQNPFSQWTFTKAGREVQIPVYDWVNDDGYNNMGDWIERAANDAGR